jgi:ADP-heptose:LPS heptosyltransferase
LNILIVRLSAIGDVVHCLPLAAVIKARLPEAKITWLVEPPARALLENNPSVDSVIVLHKKDLVRSFKHLKTMSTGFGDVKRLLTDLSAQKFDLALDVQGLLKSAALVFGAKAPIRVGFKGAREMSGALMTDLLDVGDYYGLSRHVVDHNIDLANFALEVLAKKKNLVLQPAPASAQFPLPPLRTADYQAIAAFLAGSFEVTGGASSGAVSQPDVAAPPEAPKNLNRPDALMAPPEILVSGASAAPMKPPVGQNDGARSQKLSESSVVLIPGTTWITKIWPAHHWLELGKMLLDAGVRRLVLAGGPADAKVNAEIFQALSEYIYKDDELTAAAPAVVADLTAKTGLMQLVALFKTSDVVIAADTGPMHLAVASEHPLVVAVHGSTPWLRNGPYGPEHFAVHTDIACQPCFSKTCAIKSIECLRDLPAQMVFDAIQSKMQA